MVVFYPMGDLVYKANTHPFVPLILPKIAYKNLTPLHMYACMHVCMYVHMPHTVLARSYKYVESQKQIVSEIQQAIAIAG